MMIIRWQTFTHGFAALRRKAWRLICRRPLLTDKKTQDERLAICYKCDQLIPKSNQCNICTCFVHTKVLFTDEICEAKPRKW